MTSDSLDDLLKLSNALPGLPDGLQAAYAYSDEEWRDKATAVARKLAQAGEPFTVDDLRRHGVPDPTKHQHWGSLIAGLSYAKIIELHGLALHRSPGGAVEAVRVWIGGPEAFEEQAA